MPRIKLVIEYDGSRYHGFQLQLNANTIQAEIEKAIKSLTGNEVTIHAAGRTDAGVHALEQVAAFTTCSSIPADRWKYALNSMLPPDIHIIESSLADDNFHPRFNARKKRYVYQIYRAATGTTFYRKYAWCTEESLDITEMKAACHYIKGRHDFRSFCSSGSSVKDFTREVYKCDFQEESPFLKLEIEADGFLYNMVRIIMGTLMEVGRGHYRAGYVEKIIAARDRRLAGPTAPPQGLYLASIEYENINMDSTL